MITPARAQTTDNVTPRLSGRPKLRPGSAASTPGTGTPGSIKTNSAFPSPRLAGYISPADRESLRPAPRLAASALGVQSPLAQEPISANTIRSFEDVSIKNHNSMFFHADDAPSKDKSTTTAQPAKRPGPGAAAFFYANGQREQSSQPRILRPASPAMSVFIEKRGGGSQVGRSGTSEVGLGSRPSITSPTLSAISFARSPFGVSPTGGSPVVLSPALQKIDYQKIDYLNTPQATINYMKLRPSPSSYDTPCPNTPSSGISPSPGLTPSTGLGVTLSSPIEHLSAQSPSRHIKSSSISTIPSESPSAVRKRSATWAEAQSPARARAGEVQGNDRSQPASPTVRRTMVNPVLTSPIIADAMGSPTKELIDFAADARRERKVLDLEISNSSLLAINRSLEREIKKQKAELKRYRRLSRAGRFSVAADGLYDGELLPHVDGALIGRPSSPFQEDVSDLEQSEDEDEESDDGLSSLGRTKEEKQRAKDEAQVRSDLRKHRELLLDTARMNRSLQRCLTWTEDLIKDGKKALEHTVPASDIRLGGRVLNVDETDDENASAIDDSGFDRSGAESMVDDSVSHDMVDDLESIEAFLGIGGTWRSEANQERLSMDTESTNRDSGVDINPKQIHQTMAENRPLTRVA